MKSRFFFSFFFLAQLSFGQSDKHIKIPGTKCSLIPPSGFVAATSFSGFQNAEAGASIMVNELPGPYQSMADGFTADALKSRGMTLISKEFVDHNNAKATLVNLTQSANGIVYLKQILIFGDNNGTILVNGIYPEASKQLEAKIKEALLSTRYNAAQIDDPLEAATFTLDVSGSDFKVPKYMSGGLVYTIDGKVPTEKPILIVGNSIAKISTANQKQFAIDRIKKLPRGESSVIKETSEVTIDQLKGYEIVAEGVSKENKPEQIYQVMLFNDAGDYYLIIGQTKEEFPKYLETFKKIARTFKRK
jgi:hypothetical protein